MGDPVLQVGAELRIDGRRHRVVNPSLVVDGVAGCTLFVEVSTGDLRALTPAQVEAVLEGAAARRAARLDPVEGNGTPVAALPPPLLSSPAAHGRQATPVEEHQPAPDVWRGVVRLARLLLYVVLLLAAIYVLAGCHEGQSRPEASTTGQSRDEGKASRHPAGGKAALDPRHMTAVRLESTRGVD